MLAPICQRLHRNARGIFLLSIPSSYEWKFTPTTKLIKRLSNIHKNEEWNKIYWRDLAENLQAFSVVTYHRQIGIIAPASRALNSNELLAAAVLARAAIELSAWSLYSTNIIRNAVLNIAKKCDPLINRYTADALQTLLVKMLWGTRLGHENSELKQLNILTVLDKLSKHDKENFLLPTYNLLCEAAHPNVIGNNEYLEYPENQSENDSFTIRISKSPTRSKPNELLEHTLGGLGWAAVCQRNAMLQIRESLETIGEKFL